MLASCLSFLPSFLPSLVTRLPSLCVLFHPHSRFHHHVASGSVRMDARACGRVYFSLGIRRSRGSISSLPFLPPPLSLARARARALYICGTVDRVSLKSRSFY